MSEITRYAGPYAGRCKAVAANGLVWAVATGAGDTVAGQTRATLSKLAETLSEAGTDFHHLVEAVVYLKDMSAKAEMDAVWCEMLPEDGWPCRACVGTDLAPGDLVEIKLTALQGTD